MDDIVPFLVVLVLVVAVVGAYIFNTVRTRKTAHVLATPKVSGLKLRPLAEVMPVAWPQPQPQAPSQPAPAPLFDLELEPVAFAPPAEMVWSKQFDPRSGSLDDTARLRLIGDLGVVAKEWCVPLLAQAYEEERRPGHRQAALIALAACHSRAAASTFRAALASGDSAERAIATDGLADLEPPPQTKTRRTVERH